MRKIKAFCGIVSVIALMTVFSLIPEVTKAYTQTSEDTEFFVWLGETSDKLLDDIKSIDDEMSKGDDYDWEILKSFFELLYVHAETALNEIDDFKVSSELKSIKKEFKLHLIDMKWAAYYGKETAEEILSGDIEGAGDNYKKYVEHRESATVHLEKVWALVEELPTPTPTPIELPEVLPTQSPTPRSFEAIFAISSLLAVVYLMLRKRIE